MMKVKIKLWAKILLIILIVIGVYLIAKENKNEIKPIEEDNIVIKESIIDVVYNKLKDKGIDKDFIEWIDKNYNGKLEEFDEILKNEEYNEKQWHIITGFSYRVLKDLYNNNYDEMDNIKIIESKEISELSFVGDISLADNWYIMPKYDQRGKKVKGILSDSVLKIMIESDLMVANSEFTVSNRGKKMNGKQYTFRAKPERLKIYEEMGVDLVTLANNHVYDFGKEAFLDMLDYFDKYEIPHIGAGHNLEEAKKEYYFVINGYKIAFLNGTRAEKYILTPGAEDNKEGVFRCYDPTNMINQIKKVKENSDFVIVLLHYGKEGSHDLEKEQIDSSKKYIDAGADVIIGSHAHVLQGIEFYKGKPIIYNLGDFIFNGNEEETAIFQIKLDKNGVMEYYIYPALQKNMYTDLLTGNEKEKLISKINSWSVNASIDKEGKITQK